MINRRYARIAVIAATIVEAVPLTIGLWALVTMGRHPGGAIFAGLHRPAMFLLFAFDPVLEYFLVRGLFGVAEVVSYVLVVIAQIGFFATIIYWLIKYWNPSQHVFAVPTAAAWAELFLAAILTFVSLESLWGAFLPDSDPRARYEEWSWLAFLATTPLAASLWLTGIALLRNWRLRWVAHAVPGMLLLCTGLLLWWAG